MEELNIHSITFLAFKMGKPDGCLMVSVEQGIIDKNLCRSSLKHVFEADSIETAIPEILARAKIINGMGELLKLKGE